MLESMIAGLDMKHGVIPVAWDDVNDVSVLNPDMVIKARKTEMEYLRKMQAYDGVPRYMIWQARGKLIDTRWIDTSKADERVTRNTDRDSLAGSSILERMTSCMPARLAWNLFVWC